MKHLLHKLSSLRLLMLLAALLGMGSSTAWADETTYTFTSKSWAATSGGSAANWTSGKDGDQLTSGRGIQVTTGASGANGTSPVSFTNVTKIVVTYTTNANKGAGSITCTIGDNSGTSKSVTKTGGTTDRTLEYTYDTPQSGYVNVTVACTTNSIYVKSVAITTQASGGGSSTYTVIYDANGGTGTMTDPNSPYEEDDEVTLLSNTFTAPEGKLFSSWAVTDAEDNTVTVTDGKFTMPASNVTVAAQWVNDPDAPQYEWIETDIASLTASDIFVIVGNNGSDYAMTNDNGTASAPAATEVTVTGTKITSSVADNIRWNISGNSEDGYIFYPNGSTTTWLYCISNNNGLRVGTGDEKTFEIKNSYIFNKGQSRYCGIYISSDWRSYTSINSNIEDQSFKFYKRSVAKSDPSLTVSTSSLSLGYGEVKSFTISNSGDATPSIAGYDDTVISVEQDGSDESKYNVTYLKEGSTTITVSVAETSTYAGDSKEITVTATDGRSEAGIAFASALQSAVIAAGTSFTQALTNTNSVSPITWTSSDETVATVASDGTVTLKKAGTVTITASFAGNSTYKPAEVSYTLTITDKYVAELVFAADEVEKNSTDAPFTNDIATDPDPIDVVYSSSDTGVATVNASTGEVTIVGGGTTTITATIDDDDYEATEFTYTLTVNKVAAPISFSSASATTALDETESFVAPTLTNPQSLTIAYSSSNTSVASVDEGTGAITFKAVGNTTITATSTATAKYNSGEVSYTLTVTKGAETLPFSHSFTSGSGMGDFTTSASGIWTVHNTYGAVAQGTTSENWLLSPIINLTDESYATLTFSHATNGVTTPLADNATLWVKEVGGDWTEQALTYSDNSSWTYVDQEVSLNSFCGKKIQLGFKYVSSNTTGKWEIRNLRVADDRVEAPISFAEATVYELLKNKDTYEGQALTNDESLTVSYTSSNTDVATVNASTGVVTIKAVGETDITATYDGGADYKGNTATYRLVVTSKAAAGIEYAEDAVSKKITLGTYTHELTNPHDLTIAYTSSDETVATVNASTGEVTMLKTGETIITATFTEDEDYDGATASYTMTIIKDDAVLSFASSEVNASLADGTYRQVVSTTPAELPITYSSSNESVAAVASDGTVTLKTNGVSTITANFAGNALYNSASKSYTLNVLIDYATLPFEYDGNGTGTLPKGLTPSGLSTYSSSPKMQFNGTGDYLILKYAGSANVLTFDIKGNGFSGGTFKVQYSEDGSSYTDLETYDALNAKQSESFDNIPASARYIKWIYTNKSTGNVALGNISLNECEAITVGSAGYTTHVTSHKVSMPDGVTAYIATATGESTVSLSSIENVPASTAIVLKGAEGPYKLPVITTAADDTSANILLASDGSVTGDDENIFALGKKNGEVGFYLVADGVTVPAGKAYLDLTGSSVKEFLSFDFEDLPTGLNDVRSKMEDVSGEIFNLAGQKMNRLQKGINIVNGRKVFVK